MTPEMAEFLKRYGTHSFILLVGAVINNPSVTDDDLISEVQDGLQLLRKALESLR